MHLPEPVIPADAAVVSGKISSLGMPPPRDHVPAEAIVEHARGAGLYVHDSPELVALLMRVDFDADIPPEFYRVIAEFLIWLYDSENAASTDLSP